MSDVDPRAFLEGETGLRTHAFVQWKGTDVCMDFYCDCNEQCHFDGYFAYVVECPACGKQWEMPCILFPRPTKRDGPLVKPEREDEDEREPWFTA